jgi:AcrR family transcriptional regulator
LPKDTFYNLPKDKAGRIEEAAIDEFMVYSFEAASVNRIVARAGIAKGSFYQYFADKKDLYKHILNQIVEQKMAYLSPVMANPMSVDFYTLLKEIYMSGLRFAQSNPRLQKIGNLLIADRNSPIYQEFVQENMSRSDQTFQMIIANGIERGDIRPDIDVPMIAWMISRMNVLLADYYQEHVKLELDERYLAAADHLINFICNGISNPKE